MSRTIQILMTTAVALALAGCAVALDPGYAVGPAYVPGPAVVAPVFGVYGWEHRGWEHRDRPVIVHGDEGARHAGARFEHHRG